MTAAPMPASSRPQCSAVSSANSITRRPFSTPGFADADEGCGSLTGMLDHARVSHRRATFSGDPGFLPAGSIEVKHPARFVAILRGILCFLQLARAEFAG